METMLCLKNAMRGARRFCGCLIQRRGMTLRHRMWKIKFSEQADVAQLVEQPIRNRQVTGSSPVVGSRKCLAFLSSIPNSLDEPNSYLIIHGIFALSPCVHWISVG